MAHQRDVKRDGAQVFEEFVLRYGPKAGEEGIIRFAEEVFGIELDEWQEKVLRDIGRGERRVSVAACHGPGKTFAAAIAVNHKLVCHFPQHVVVTAPSKGQLEGALVKEVKILFKQLPPVLQELFEVKKTRIELRAAPEESYFEARTAREEKPEALQGVHCDGGFVLLIADEASGIHEKIYEAAAGSMSGHNTTTLLLSNPTRSSGFFFDTHHKLADMWCTYRVSHEDSDRVTDDFVEDIRRRYGEDSNAYRVRCQGLFPKTDDDTVIPYEFCIAARDRDITLPPAHRMDQIWSLDVARFGDDANCLLKRNRLAVLPDIQVWGGVDLMETTGRVKLEWDDTPEVERPSQILVDVIGYGAAVVDRLRELGLPVRGINVAEGSSYKDRYLNLRAELWFTAREWLMKQDRKLPKCEGGCSRDCNHERLVQELTAPKYETTSSGKLKVESKADMKKRGHRSPNVADAMVLSFASEPAGLVHGSSDGWNDGPGWGEAISRGLPMV